MNLGIPQTPWDTPPEWLPQIPGKWDVYCTRCGCQSHVANDCKFVELFNRNPGRKGEVVLVRRGEQVWDQLTRGT